jgi:hypothetical protein
LRKKEKNMNRLRVGLAIAVLVLVAVLSLPTFGDEAVLRVSPVSSSVSVGKSLTLDVNISNVTNLYGFQFDLSFAPGTLSAVSIVEGSFLASVGATLYIPGTIDNVGGTITSTADTLLGPGSGVNGTGTLAVLTLTGLAPGNSSIDLSNLTLLNSNLSPISASLQNGSVRVASGMAPAPEPNSLLLSISGIGLLAFGFLRRR